MPMAEAKTRISKAIASGDIAEFLAAGLEDEALPESERDTLFHYYRSYRNNFGDYIRTHYARQSRELIQAIQSRHTPTVLEVGCGCGTESLWAAIHGADVVGIDISEDFIRVANTRAAITQEAIGETLRCEFRCESLLDIDSEPGFDIVWLEQAFHHMEPRHDVVESLAAIVKSNGLLIISESNAWNPLLQAALFKRRGFRTVRTQWGHAWGDERILTPHRLSRLFRQEHIRPVSLSYFRVLPNLPLPGRLMLGLERLVPSPAVPFFTHYNWVGRKTPDRSSGVP